MDVTDVLMAKLLSSKKEAETVKIYTGDFLKSSGHIECTPGGIYINGILRDVDKANGIYFFLTQMGIQYISDLATGTIIRTIYPLMTHGSETLDVTKLKAVFSAEYNRYYFYALTEDGRLFWCECDEYVLDSLNLRFTQIAEDILTICNSNNTLYCLNGSGNILAADNSMLNTVTPADFDINMHAVLNITSQKNFLFLETDIGTVIYDTANDISIIPVDETGMELSLEKIQSYSNFLIGTDADFNFWIVENFYPTQAKNNYWKPMTFNSSYVEPATDFFTSDNCFFIMGNELYIFDEKFGYKGSAQNATLPAETEIYNDTDGIHFFTIGYTDTRKISYETEEVDIITAIQKLSAR